MKGSSKPKRTTLGPIERLTQLLALTTNVKQKPPRRRQRKQLRPVIGASPNTAYPWRVNHNGTAFVYPQMKRIMKK